MTANCQALDSATAHVVGMIVRQSAPDEILAALCLGLGASPAERQAAIFLFDGESWNFAASGDLSEESADVMTAIRPERIAQRLLEEPDGAAPLQGGYARLLQSGVGEMLGLLVLLLPDGERLTSEKAARIAAACHLGALAVEQRNLMAELAWQVDHDSATGLYTRNRFERFLAERLRIQSVATALLFIDLDRFRLVNEVLGYAVGNRALKQISRRLEACMPPGAVLSRVGGDEFAALVYQTADSDDAGIIADRIMAVLAVPIAIDEHELYISASIGIGVSGPGSTPESLQREAHVAGYHAKHTGKSKWVHFDRSMAVAPPERLEMEKRLRAAIHRGEMLLYYQPQIELRGGAISGAEVLLRWKPDGLGIISPAAFVPILEETGLISEFGRWVIRQACLQGRRWLQECGQRLRLAVNVSAVQLRDPEFAADVERILSETGFPPELLELELTESLIVPDFETASSLFRNLQRTGVTLAIDDFGIGQSSLTYLQRLPFQRLKIDQAFIRAMTPGDARPALIENILRMARQLKMEVIAEGIDRPEQAAVLRDLGCDHAQGYLFAMPMPAEDFARRWHELARKAAGLIAPVQPTPAPPARHPSPASPPFATQAAPAIPA